MYKFEHIPLDPIIEKELQQYRLFIPAGLPMGSSIVLTGTRYSTGRKFYDYTGKCILSCESDITDKMHMVLMSRGRFYQKVGQYLNRHCPYKADEPAALETDRIIGIYRGKASAVFYYQDGRYSVRFRRSRLVPKDLQFYDCQYFGNSKRVFQSVLREAEACIREHGIPTPDAFSELVGPGNPVDYVVPKEWRRYHVIDKGTDSKPMYYVYTPWGEVDSVYSSYVDGERNYFAVNGESLTAFQAAEARCQQFNESLGA